MPINHPEQARGQLGLRPTDGTSRTVRGGNARMSSLRDGEPSTHWTPALAAIIAAVSLVFLVYWIFGP